MKISFPDIKRERERLSLSAFLRTEDIGVHIVHISCLIITWHQEEAVANLHTHGIQETVQVTQSLLKHHQVECLLDRGHRNQNVVILTTFSFLAATEVVRMTTLWAASNEKVTILTTSSADSDKKVLLVSVDGSCCRKWKWIVHQILSHPTWQTQFNMRGDLKFHEQLPTSWGRSKSEFIYINAVPRFDVAIIWLSTKYSAVPL